MSESPADIPPLLTVHEWARIHDALNIRRSQLNGDPQEELLFQAQAKLQAHGRRIAELQIEPLAQPQYAMQSVRREGAEEEAA